LNQGREVILPALFILKKYMKNFFVNFFKIKNITLNKKEVSYD